jgi:hypothetical protein
MNNSEKTEGVNKNEQFRDTVTLGTQDRKLKV